MKCVSDVGGGNVQAESLGSDERNAHRLSFVCWCCAVVFTVVVVHSLHAALCISCKSRITSRPPCLISPPFLPQEWSKTAEDLLQCELKSSLFAICLLDGLNQGFPRQVQNTAYSYVAMGLQVRCTYSACTHASSSRVHLTTRSIELILLLCSHSL